MTLFLPSPIIAFSLSVTCKFLSQCFNVVPKIWLPFSYCSFLLRYLLVGHLLAMCFLCALPSCLWFCCFFFLTLHLTDQEWAEQIFSIDEPGKVRHFLWVISCWTFCLISKTTSEIERRLRARAFMEETITSSAGLALGWLNILMKFRSQ